MKNDLFNLEEVTVLITGGAGHLGKAIVRGLTECGATVYVLSRDEERFREAFGSSSQISFASCDVGDRESIRNAYAQVAEDAGRIDVLINHAFFTSGQDPLDISELDWANGIDGTLSSVYRCIREGSVHLRPGGKIINTASMYGMVSPDFRVYDGRPENLNPPHYGAAKAGVLQLTRYFAVYLAPRGILVNSVTPGAFPTPEVCRDASFVTELESRIPLGRVGRPDDLAGTFVFLSSAAANYITGQNIVVDGGWTAW